MSELVAFYPSLVGTLRVTATQAGISHLEILDSKPKTATSNGFPKKIIQELDAYFKKKKRSFRLPLDLQGTAFQKKVWSALQEVPYGTTLSYSDLAKCAGRPKAVRAAASAVARNPIAVVVPCHRIVRSTGEIGQYAYGSAKKEWLLKHEKESR